MAPKEASTGDPGDVLEYEGGSGLGLAVGGLVCAVVGVGIGLSPIFYERALIGGALGIVLGAVGYFRASGREAMAITTCKRLCVAAVVTGVISLALGIQGGLEVTGPEREVRREQDQASNLRETLDRLVEEKEEAEDQVSEDFDTGEIDRKTFENRIDEIQDEYEDKRDQAYEDAD